jgi:FkbM family methyltransferase
MSWKIMDLKLLVDKHNLSSKGVGHIGAWKAEEIHDYKELFGDVPVVFVEANEKLRPYIEEHINQYSNVRCEYVALGSEESTRDFYIHEVDGDTGQSSSLLTTHLHHPIGNKTIKVDVTTADLLFEKDCIDFLAIDVQGFELEVLKGATKLLSNVNNIITEVNRTEQYKNCALIEDIDNFLKPFNFVRTETEWYNNTEDWGDALYKKVYK